MKTLQDFADGLKAAKDERMVSASKLADEVGLSKLTVRNILSAEAAPLLTNAMALASALGLELVMVPKDVAQSLSEAKKPHTVLSNVERRLASGSSVDVEDVEDKSNK
jgi:ribosome-binding protein aMBF1 (putative translation factor)